MFWSNEIGGVEATIDELYIKEDFRNKGIATDFLNNIKNIIPEAVSMSLEVTPNNLKARKLYESIGFTLAENQQLIKIL